SEPRSPTWLSSAWASLRTASRKLSRKRRRALMSAMSWSRSSSSGWVSPWDGVRAALLSRSRARSRSRRPWASSVAWASRAIHSSRSRRDSSPCRSAAAMSSSMNWSTCRASYHWPRVRNFTWAKASLVSSISAVPLCGVFPRQPEEFLPAVQGVDGLHQAVGGEALRQAQGPLQLLPALGAVCLPGEAQLEQVAFCDGLPLFRRAGGGFPLQDGG